MIGGRERVDGDAVILRRVVRLAGGADAFICICTVASEVPVEAALPYERAFERLGAAGSAVLHLQRRADASRRESLQKLARASALFFTGGDQLRLTSLVGGTPFERLLRARLREGGLVAAGTSAGASAFSGTMIVGGDADEAPKMNTIRMAPGLGLLQGVVVDQHFAQRGRIGRLLSALAQNPRALGLGLDEDTAVEIDRSGRFQVLGSQTVTVLDGRRARFTNASETSPEEPLALGGLTLHVLPSGYGFDLASRHPIPPHEAWTPRAQDELDRARTR